MVKNIKHIQPRLGDILINYHLITPEQLSLALTEQKSTKERLGAILVRKGWSSEEDISFVLGQQLDLPYVQLTQDMIDEELVKSVPSEILFRYSAIPLIKVDDRLTVVMSDPTDTEAISDIEKITGSPIQPALGKTTSIRNLLEILLGHSDIPLSDTVKTGSLDFYHNYLEQAMSQQAGEIHFEPTPQYVRVRYRIADTLIERDPLNNEQYQPLILRTKILFHFDLSMKDKSFSGTIPMEIQKQKIQLEGHIFPTLYGESITLRFHTLTEGIISEDSLEIDKDLHQQMKSLLQRTSGVILVTCSLDTFRQKLGYWLLQQLQPSLKKIITVESNLNISNPDYLQLTTEITPNVQLPELFNHAISMGGDVILVDLNKPEILLKTIFETARRQKLIIGLMSYRNIEEVLSLIGNSGVNHSLISSYLLGIIGADTLRKICPHCRKAVSEKKNALPGKKFYIGIGCKKCKQKGFLGTFHLYEVLENTPDVQKQFMKKKTFSIHPTKFESIQSKALKLAREGKVSIKELHQKWGSLS